MKHLLNKFLLIETANKDRFWGHFTEFDAATDRFCMSNMTRAGAAPTAKPTKKWFQASKCRVIQVCATPKKAV